MNSDKVLTLDEIISSVTSVCSEFGVEMVYLFGSYAAGCANEKSDIDLSIERGHVHGFRMGGLYNALVEKLGKNVDILNRNCIDADTLSKISNKEILIYEKNES